MDFFYFYFSSIFSHEFEWTSTNLILNKLCDVNLGICIFQHFRDFFLFITFSFVLQSFKYFIFFGLLCLCQILSNFSVSIEQFLFGHSSKPYAKLVVQSCLWHSGQCQSHLNYGWLIGQFLFGHRSKPHAKLSIHPYFSHSNQCQNLLNFRWLIGQFLFGPRSKPYAKLFFRRYL